MPAKKNKPKETKEKKSKGVEPNLLHLIAQLTEVVKDQKNTIDKMKSDLSRVLDRMGL